eukprot:gene24401-29497_t
MFAQIELLTPMTASHEKRLIRYLYIGEYMGLTIVCLISYIVAWLGAQVFPPGYIELMGLGPLCLGFYNLVHTCLYGVGDGLQVDAPEGMTRVYSDIPDLLEAGLFYTMLFIMLHIAYSVTHIHVVIDTIKHYGVYIVPVIWVCIGFYILSSSILVQYL